MEKCIKRQKYCRLDQIECRQVDYNFGNSFDYAIDMSEVAIQVYKNASVEVSKRNKKDKLRADRQQIFVFLIFF